VSRYSDRLTEDQFSRKQAGQIAKCCLESKARPQASPPASRKWSGCRPARSIVGWLGVSLGMFERRNDRGYRRNLDANECPRECSHASTILEMSKSFTFMSSQLRKYETMTGKPHGGDAASAHRLRAEPRRS
jgi:hypothetical protein